MNSLDSRYLRRGDTFGHRFTVPGAHRYTVAAPGGIAPAGHHGAFAIEVAEARGAARKTHYLRVSYAAKAFTVDCDHLSINADDLVLWSTQDAAAPGFCVQGGSAAARFDSAELPKNSLYSHAFGTTGVFEWSDAHEPALRGIVTVAAHPPCRTREHRDAYMRKLSEPNLVMIDAPKAHPHAVSISVGQTVFFAVRSGAGVSIVERALLAAGRTALNPQPLPP